MSKYGLLVEMIRDEDKDLEAVKSLMYDAYSSGEITTAEVSELEDMIEEEALYR